MRLAAVGDGLWRPWERTCGATRGRATRPALAPAGSADSASPGVNADAPGGAAVADHAAELIELITTTLAPETWEQNGGEGSIYYFNNFRVLVVRQTAEIHHRPER